jgi:hypothetical protein
VIKWEVVGYGGNFERPKKEPKRPEKDLKRMLESEPFSKAIRNSHELFKKNGI